MTLSGNYNTWALSTTTARPADPPKGLIATNVVQTADGYRGQVLIDGKIIRESEPFGVTEEDLAAAKYPANVLEDAKREALAWANNLVVDRIKRLFQE